MHDFFWVVNSCDEKKSGSEFFEEICPFEIRGKLSHCLG